MRFNEKMIVHVIHLMILFNFGMLHRLYWFV